MDGRTAGAADAEAVARAAAARLREVARGVERLLLPDWRSPAAEAYRSRVLVVAALARDAARLAEEVAAGAAAVRAAAAAGVAARAGVA